MKFKKWILENKYGIPQMKLWSIEQPVKEDANSNFSTFDKEVSMYRFIAPNLINLSKDLCKNFKIAIGIYGCSLAWYGLAYLSANNDKIFNEVFKPHAVDIIPIVIMNLLFIEMFHLVKNIFTETRTVREMFYIFTLSVLLIYLNIFLKGKLMSLDLLNRIVMITILVETVSSMILFIYDVIRVVSAYKRGNYIVIYEEKRTNYRFVKQQYLKRGIIMSTYYRDIQIIKHALQFYIKRPDANEKDLEKEKKLLKKVENKVSDFKKSNNIK